MKFKMLIITAALLALCSMGFAQSQFFGIANYGAVLTLTDGITPCPDGTTIWIVRSKNDCVRGCPGGLSADSIPPQGNQLEQISYNNWPMNGSSSLGQAGEFTFDDVGYALSGGGQPWGGSSNCVYAVIPYGDGSFAWVGSLHNLIITGNPQDFEDSDPANWQRLPNCWTFVPPVLGRCCYGDPFAPQCQVVSQAACTALGSSDWVANTTCANNPCPVQVHTGRCCYGDPFAPTCAINTQAQCTALGSSDWIQDGTCAGNPCPVQQHVGRCCYGDPFAPSCQSPITLAACNQLNGQWLQDASCASAPCPVQQHVGRCCYGNPFAPSCASPVTLAECNNLQGSWLQDGTCAANPCPITPPNGRCCYNNNHQCADVTQAACNALIGVWTQGASCADGCPPPLGACCYNHGVSCQSPVTLAVCGDLGGTWYDGMTCAQIRANGSCVVPALGRCCYRNSDGTLQCADNYHFECDALNGSWDSTTTCAASPCVVPCSPSADFCINPVPCPSYPCPENECVCFTLCFGQVIHICIGPLSDPSRMPVGHLVHNSCQAPFASGEVWDGTWSPAINPNPNCPPGFYYCTTISLGVGGTEGSLQFCLDQILPVSLTSFDAMPRDNAVELAWVTGAESGVDHIVIERSVAGHEFTAIGTVPAQNSGANGSHYTFTDAQAQNGVTYTYRLSAINVDGSSDIWLDHTVTATPSTTDGGVPGEYALLQNYPNPFNPTTQIVFDVAEANFVNLRVFNSSGQEVAVLANGDMSAGRHSVTFDGKNLTSGVYFYTVKIGNAFTATKKMLLMK